jgi:CheY-like chemotaxis protein
MPLARVADPLSQPGRDRPLILMVDDNLDQLDLYAMLLEERLDVLKASRGEMAYTLACAQRPDAIVLDLLLPDVDGFEVYRRLRSNRETFGIPVVLLTGDEGSFFRAISLPECANVFAVLKKPAQADELLATVDAAMKHRPA